MGPWRRDPICGDVHDDNAYILGGVAGHAGLFGSATQCVALALEWLQAIKSTDDAKHQGLLSPPTARLFWNTSYPSGQGRALGWDKKSTTATMSAAGEHLTPAARGHLGFTGTSLWIDPDHDLIITCLTNRVYLAKGETKQMDRAPMAAFRYKLHTLIAGELLNINTKRRSP
jgi:CubicO group peptidase (beta-lactamase class C family)